MQVTDRLKIFFRNKVFDYEEIEGEHYISFADEPPYFQGSKKEKEDFCTELNELKKQKEMEFYENEGGFNLRMNITKAIKEEDYEELKGCIRFMIGPVKSLFILYSAYAIMFKEDLESEEI